MREGEERRKIDNGLFDQIWYENREERKEQRLKDVKVSVSADFMRYFQLADRKSCMDPFSQDINQGIDS